jgi:hypothetical protein
MNTATIAILMGLRGRWRKWYTVEKADGREYHEIKCWLNFSMYKLEQRHGVKVKNKRITTRYGNQPETRHSKFYVMEARSWEGSE